MGGPSSSRRALAALFGCVFWWLLVAALLHSLSFRSSFASALFYSTQSGLNIGYGQLQLVERDYSGESPGDVCAQLLVAANCVFGSLLGVTITGWWYEYCLDALRRKADTRWEWLALGAICLLAVGFLWSVPHWTSGWTGITPTASFLFAVSTATTAGIVDPPCDGDAHKLSEGERCDRMDDGVAIAVAMGATVAVLAWAAIAAKVAARFTNWLAPTSPDSSGATGGAASVKTKAMPGRTDWRVL